MWRRPGSIAERIASPQAVSARIASIPPWTSPWRLTWRSSTSIATVTAPGDAATTSIPAQVWNGDAAIRSRSAPRTGRVRLAPSRHPPGSVVSHGVPRRRLTDPRSAGRIRAAGRSRPGGRPRGGEACRDGFERSSCPLAVLALVAAACGDDGGRRRGDAGDEGHGVQPGPQRRHRLRHRRDRGQVVQRRGQARPPVGDRRRARLRGEHHVRSSRTRPGPTATTT